MKPSGVRSELRLRRAEKPEVARYDSNFVGFLRNCKIGTIDRDRGLSDASISRLVPDSPHAAAGDKSEAELLYKGDCLDRSAKKGCI